MARARKIAGSLEPSQQLREQAQTGADLENPFTGKVVEKILVEVKDERLSIEALKPALDRAFEAYALALGTRTMQEEGRADAQEVSELVTRLQSITTKWGSLDPSVRGSIETFLGLSERPVADRLERLTGDLEEFSLHWRRGKGNPGKAHIGRAVDLEPLKTFAAALRDFWVTAKLGAFSHRFEAAYKTHDQDYPNTSVSPALKLLCACAVYLNRDFDVRQCSTAIRNIDKRLF